MVDNTISKIIEADARTFAGLVVLSPERADQVVDVLMRDLQKQLVREAALVRFGLGGLRI